MSAMAPRMAPTERATQPLMAVRKRSTSQPRSAADAYGDGGGDVGLHLHEAGGEEACGGADDEEGGQDDRRDLFSEFLPHIRGRLRFGKGIGVHKGAGVFRLFQRPSGPRWRR